MPLYNSEGSKVDETGAATGQDEAQGVESEYSEYDFEASEHVTHVYATKESTFSVLMPKTIILSGDGEHTGEYVLKVKGDVEDDDTISITQQETEIELYILKGNKDPITATVTQEEDTIAGADIGEDWTTLANGIVAAPGLKAGSWQGTLSFNIVIDKAEQNGTGEPNEPELDPDIDYVDFVITKGNRAKIGYQGIENEELVIPATFQDEDGIWYKVTSIGSWAFYDCTSLTSVTSIGDYAFRNVPHIEYHGTAAGSPWGAKSMN